MGLKRSTKNQSVLGINDVSSIEFNIRAGAKKVVEVGPELAIPAGDVQTHAQDYSASDNQINPGTTFWFYNNSATTAWVTFSKAAIVTAPTGLANAIPLKANDWTRLNSGENTHVQTSAATVGVYIVKDDVTAQVIADDQAL